MIIREAKETDVNDIINLFNQLDEFHRIYVENTYKIISDDFRRDHFLKCLSNESNYFIVAIEDEKVVGFIDAYKEKIQDHPVKEDVEFIMIENVVVDNEYKRRGIATELFNYIENIAKNTRIGYIKLGVYEFNDAKLFYENMGYQTETRKLIKKL